MSYNDSLVPSPPSEIKVLSILAENSWKTVVRYFKLKLELVSNILWVIAEFKKIADLDNVCW